MQAESTTNHPRTTPRLLAKVILTNVLLGFALVIGFDLSAYILAPYHLVAKFSEYRNNSVSDIAGRREYPVDYFVKDSKKGFDIGPNRRGSHWVDGLTYDIWSNSLGCFDSEHTSFGNYVYFAGDSYTWGYAPFEDKFGTIIDNRTNAPILKCGVGHTGQLHQFEKLEEIVSKVGAPPAAIFLMYSTNDIANDFVHPHTTVIDGWQVDTVAFSRHNELLRFTESQLRERLEDRLSKIEARRRARLDEPVKTFLKKYSLSANIVYFGIVMSLKDSIASNSPTQEPDVPRIRTLYSAEQIRNDRHWFNENPISESNKQALLNFQQTAKTYQSDFVVVLIPDVRGENFDGQWFAEVREFLAEHGIEYLDLTFPFIDLGHTPKDLYWRIDGHLNIRGNRVVAEILMKEYAEIFGISPNSD